VSQSKLLDDLGSLLGYIWDTSELRVKIEEWGSCDGNDSSGWPSEFKACLDMNGCVCDR